jgi:Ca2+-binding EF-hand superfamily protein
MRIHWFRACAAAAALAMPVAALAQVTAAREQAFRDRDKNGDGVLTLEEYGGHPGNFRAMDANGDHVLSRDEFVNRYREGGDTVTSAPVAPVAPANPAQSVDVFGMMDRNNDGVISRSEWRSDLVLHTFERTDRNRNGVVTRDEFANPLPGDYRDQRFAEWDRNNDGVIVRSEWRTDPFSFNRADRNNDDRVDRDEFAASIGGGSYSNTAEQRFRTLDRNGVISRGEWRGESMNFDDVDRDNDNRVTLDEYVRMSDYGSGQPSGTSDLDYRFTQLDRNRDGMLSRSEWRDSSSAFGSADRNGDGFVSRREFLYGNVTYEQPSYDDNTSRSRRFRELDANGNGDISRSEWPYDRSEFDTLDRNRDGRLSAYEFSQFSETRPSYDQFRRMDDNGDGVISRAEWNGTSQSFNDYDRNRDGVISRDEYVSY